MNKILLLTLFVLSSAVAFASTFQPTADYSGNGHNWTIPTSSAAANFSGTKGVVCDGVNDYWIIQSTDTLQSTPTYNTSDNRTVYGWIKANVYPNGGKEIYTDKFNFGSNLGWSIRLANNSNNASLTTITGGTFRAMNGSVNMTIGDYHWFKVMYNGSHLVQYLDGLLAYNSTFTGVNSSTGTNQTVLCSQDTGSAFFNGTVGAVWVYNRTTTSTDDTLFQTNSTPNTTSLIAYWPFVNTTFDYGVTINANVSQQVKNLTSLVGYQVPWLFGSVSMCDPAGNGLHSIFCNYWEVRGNFTQSGSVLSRMDTAYSNTVNANLTYKTGTNTSVGNINNHWTSVQFANNNGYEIILTSRDTPTYLSDNSSLCSYGADVRVCEPTDYYLYGQVVIAYLDNVTNNGAWAGNVMLEVLNEPYGSQWLPNASCAQKTAAYFRMYNYTTLAVRNQSRYANIPVGGPTLYNDNACSLNMTRDFYGNFSTGGALTNSWNTYNWVPIHDYATCLNTGLGAPLNDSVQAANNVTGNLSKPIIFSELNCNDAAVQNTSSRWYLIDLWKSQALSMAYNLNQNISINWYAFTSDTIYNTNTSEYPNDWRDWSYSNLNNFSHYNATNRTQTYFKNSTTTYMTSANDSRSYQTMGLYGSSYVGMIGNLDTGNASVSLNYSGITNPYKITFFNGSTQTYSAATQSFATFNVPPTSTAYFTLDTDTTAPGLSVTAPVNSTFYGGTAVTLSIAATDNQGGITTVWYNNGSQNITLFNTSTGASGFNYTNSTTISQGTNRTITVYANDTYNNVTSTTVTFNLNAISIASVSPETPTPRITLGNGQQFLFTLNNPGNVSNNTNWYADSVNITSCYNSTTCSVIGASLGTKNITFTTTSQVNNVTSTWLLTVETSGATYTRTICQGNAEGALTFSKFSSNIGLILVLAVVVVLLLGAIGVINFGEMSFQQVGFAMILFTVFVILAGVIVTVVTSSGAC